MDDKAESIKLLLQSQQVAERLGDTDRVRFAQTHIAGAMFEHGDWDEALEIADDFLADCDAGHGHVQEPETHVMRAWIHLARGDSERALADSDRVLVLAKAPGSSKASLPVCVCRRHLRRARSIDRGAGARRRGAVARGGSRG